MHEAGYAVVEGDVRRECTCCFGDVFYLAVSEDAVVACSAAVDAVAEDVGHGGGSMKCMREVLGNGLGVWTGSARGVI